MNFKHFDFYVESFSTFILFHILTTVLLQFIFFWINLSLTPISFIIPFVLWYFVSPYFYGYDKRNKRLFFNSFFYLALIGVSLYYYSHFIEISFDGNFYHGDTMIQLTYGWNPITLANKYFDSVGILWGELYPKFTWIIGSLFIQFSKMSSAGMTLNSLVAVATFIKVVDFMKKRASTWFSLLIAFVVVLNPIVIEQFHSFYVDGIIANLIAILILANLELMEDFNRKSYFIMIVVSIILMNIKFTSFAFAGLIDLSTFVYFLIKDRRNALKIVYAGLIVLVLGLFIGYRPYIVNLLQGKNIFWPLAGEGNWISGDDQVIAAMENMRSLERFFYSISYGNYFNSLIDFTSKGYLYYDQRIGAMGMHFTKFLFSGMLLALLYFVKVKFKVPLSYILMFFFFTLSIVFNFKMVWKLRYIPHFWLMVPLTFILAHYLFKNQLLVILLSLLFIHQAVDMIQNTYEYNLWVADIYKEIYAQYSDGDSYDVRIGDSDFMVVTEEYRLKEYGVKINSLYFSPVENEECHRVDMYTICFVKHD